MITKQEIISGIKSKEVLYVFIFIILASIGMLFKQYSVSVYILSIAAIAIASYFLNKDNFRVAALLGIVLLSLFSIYLNGVKFGIDFAGGVRIPILLEKPVDSITMGEMVNTIKTRTASFGLTEVKVRPVGDSEIYVELPQTDKQLIEDVEKILSTQGVYTGIIDGKIAVKGEDIYSGSIVRVPAQYLQGSDWGVSFTINQKGAKRFAEVAKGKADYPVYMFLDRPENAILIIKEKTFLSNAKNITKEEALKIAKEALKLEGDDILLYLEEDLLKNFSIKPKDNKTKAIVEISSPLIEKLKSEGFVVVEKTQEEMAPEFSFSFYSVKGSVSVWKAIGLLSAPRLAKSVTEGIPTFSYTIQGSAQGATAEERLKDGLKKEKELETILKGGALPVNITVGSKTIIPAPLGEEFLRLSLAGVAIALFVISFMVGIRYRRMKIVVPMILISFAEIIIMIAIIGSFTIDLSAMAGILAAIGTSVDAQIIVTDELLKKEGEVRRRMEKAFGIITTSVTVAVIAMLPLLLFSGLVEIIGFATSTILGSLLGLFISRPAYGVIVERIFE